MTKKETKKGEFYFGSVELLSISLVGLVIAAVMLVISMQSSYADKYQLMIAGVSNLGLSANVDELKEDKDTIYLIELIDRGLMSPMKNPFYDTKYCDTTSSSVTFKEEEPIVTLKCGEYLIDKQDLSDSEFSIYKVTEWSSTKRNSNESRKLYNYKRSGKNAFTQFYEEDMFLYAFNKENSTKYKKINEIPKKYNVFSKKFYRHKQKVSTIKEK